MQPIDITFVSFSFTFSSEKNEEEYIDNLLSVYESEETRKHKTRLFLQDKNKHLFFKKMNLFTISKRPFCNFCKAICGFTWFKSPELILCKNCMNDEQTLELREKHELSLNSVDKKELEDLKREVEAELPNAQKKES